MIQIVSGYKTIFSFNWKLHFFLISFVAVKDCGFIKVQFSLLLSQCVRSSEVWYKRIGKSLSRGLWSEVGFGRSKMISSGWHLVVRPPQ